jgi:eukaryotic-like serine/threonine-protein kinase
VTNKPRVTVEPGDVLLEKLRVVRLVGAGAMGAVYEVEHLVTKHHRALKLLHGPRAQQPEVVARFVREASAAGRIGNAHIVETLDAGELPTGEPYLLMELLQGELLSDLIGRQGALPIEFAVPVAAQACDALEAAHEAGIVHRDIKPENLIVLRSRDGRPFVKVLDFGISKFDPRRTGDHRLTQDGSFMGTPYYMSPEQIRGESVDGRTDVYSLGVVLYECLSGTRPFEAVTLEHLVVRICEGKCTPLREHRPEIPTSLEVAVARAMAGDADARFPSGAAFALALRALVPMSDPRLSELPPRRTPAPPAGDGRVTPVPPSDRASAAAPLGPTGTVSLPPEAPEAGLRSTTHAAAMSLQSRADASRPSDRVASRSRSMVWTATVGAVLLLAAGGLVTLRLVGDHAQAPPSPSIASSAATAPRAAPSTKPKPASAPSVEPAQAPDATPEPTGKRVVRRAPSETAALHGSTATAAPAPPDTAPPPATAQQPSPRTPTRAEKAGLKRDNPFKQ